MPVRRRKPKQRHSVEAEVEAWSMWFFLGRDWFGDLEKFGIDRDDNETLRERGFEAWGRIGAAWLETWEPPEHQRDRVPYALVEFGEP